jgi:4-amino-4-deoxychorismate lyase
MTIYYKGDYKTDSKVAVDPNALHFKFGAGFFETILYDGGVRHLDKHLERLTESCTQFGFTPKDIDYAKIIDRVIAENELTDSIARINVSHMIEDMNDYSLVVTASAYTPPPADKVYKLCPYPYTHDTYMSRHKSMNYMHFLMAKKYASDREYDDVLLTDSKGNILETSIAAVVLKDKDRYYAPKETARLKSISLDIFAQNHDVQFKDIHISEIGNYEIILMNSLIGQRNAEYFSK